ncbi:hypothetical protein KSP40_PGU016833 [Platanthera guangdongensis]|uniref:Uncharacterized protein n=1 Tax=Platanthera guangdongensis TaxID=2320717 RepID=A0ABR2MIH1_9ASPA
MLEFVELESVRRFGGRVAKPVKSGKSANAEFAEPTAGDCREDDHRRNVLRTCGGDVRQNRQLIIKVTNLSTLRGFTRSEYFCAQRFYYTHESREGSRPPRHRATPPRPPTPTTTNQCSSSSVSILGGEAANINDHSFCPDNSCGVSRMQEFKLKFEQKICNLIDTIRNIKPMSSKILTAFDLCLDKLAAV